MDSLLEILSVDTEAVTKTIKKRKFYKNKVLFQKTLFM